MKQKWVVCAGVLIAVFMCCGCEKEIADIKRKFTRKKKGPPQKVVRFYEGEDSRAPEYPNATLYKNHYTYWKRWAEELVEALKADNALRQQQCAESALSELRYMQELLVEDKQKEMVRYVKEMESTVNALNQGRSGSSPMRLGMIPVVERHLLHIMHNFSPQQVASAIKVDTMVFVEEKPGEKKESDEEETP